MKKHQLKAYLKLGILLFGIPILFFTCEKDIEHEENLESQDSNLFSKIDFTTFKDKVKDENIEDLDINKLVNSQTVPFGELQYRTESENFVISIDSTDALTAEKDGITSYTFKTQTTDNTKTTNYVLAHDQNNNTDEYYLTYEDDGSSKVIDPTSGYEVTAQSRGSVWCPITEEQTVCTCAGHTADECGGCAGWETVTVIIGHEYCGPSLGEGSGGGSGSGSGSGGGDGEGTGGSGDGDGDDNDLPIDGPIITKPVRPEPPSEDCQELAKNEENPLFNQYMQELEDNTANGENEKGFNILYLPPTATEPEEETFVFPPPNGVTEGTPTNVSLPNNIYRKAFAHNHIPTVPRSLKVFSPGDIGVLGEILNIQQNNPNSPLEVEQLAIYGITGDTITNQQFTFALKIENSNSKLISYAQKYPRTFRDENNNEVENPNWNKRLYRRVNRFYEDEINPNDSKNQQIDGFLNLIKELDLGASLYEKNPITDVWDKVYLDENGVVKREPCN